ncbi:hypothetical protein [Moraxella osloensis]|uniref:hypothetical protein n=1 Tax=Faucicola osloensis TaxID=34062 RepID=UPI00200555F2|nr:hypothetical protein [Moraxella osloensis]MCK6052496.1 hypothetical protein [Moraxella osloensis]
MSNITFEQVDEIALGFAEALAATNHNKDKISKDAIELAIAWVANRQDREKIFKQNFPNWQKLTPETTMQFEPGKKYWVISQQEGNARSIGYYKFVQERGNFSSEKSFEFMGYDKFSVIGEYFLHPDDAEIFDLEFQPLAPRELNIQKPKVKAQPIVKIPPITSHWG